MIIHEEGLAFICRLQHSSFFYFALICRLNCWEFTHVHKETSVYNSQPCIFVYIWRGATGTPGGRESEISTGETTLTSDSDSRLLSPARFISRLAAYQMFHLALAAPAHLYTTHSLINVIVVVSLPPSLAPSLSGRLIGHQLNSTCSPARWNTILRRREALTSYPVSSAFNLTLLLLPLLTKTSPSLSLCLCILLATYFPFFPTSLFIILSNASF